MLNYAQMSEKRIKMPTEKPIRRFMVRHADGSNSGPFTPNELRSLAESGKVEREDQIQQVGIDTWHAAGKVAGLFPDDETIILVADKAVPKPVPKREWLRARCLNCRHKCDVQCGSCGKFDSFTRQEVGFQCLCGNMVLNLPCPKCFSIIFQNTMRLSRISIADCNSPRRKEAQRKKSNSLPSWEDGRETRKIAASVLLVLVYAATAILILLMVIGVIPFLITILYCMMAGLLIAILQLYTQ